MNREPDPKEALICFVIFIIILLMMFFYMIFIERNTVRDDVSISRGITPACADDGANGAPEFNTMDKLILLQQLEAIHGEDFCSIHHAGGTIRGRCIDLYFDPEFIPLAFVQVKKIKPNFNDFEIFLV